MPGLPDAILVEHVDHHRRHLASIPACALVVRVPHANLSQDVSVVQRVGNHSAQRAYPPALLEVRVETAAVTNRLDLHRAKSVLLSKG